MTYNICAFWGGNNLWMISQAASGLWKNMGSEIAVSWYLVCITILITYSVMGLHFRNCPDLVVGGRKGSHCFRWMPWQHMSLQHLKVLNLPRPWPARLSLMWTRWSSMSLLKPLRLQPSQSKRIWGMLRDVSMRLSPKSKRLPHKAVKKSLMNLPSIMFLDFSRVKNASIVWLPVCKSKNKQVIHLTHITLGNDSIHTSWPTVVFFKPNMHVVFFWQKTFLI